jgi:hypothetical protein
MKNRAATLMLIAAAAAPAAAQEYQVSRRVYPFFASNLTIEVRTRSPGSLEILRGGRGRIEVAGRATNSVLGYAPPRLPGEPLRLTALGGSEVHYLVIVPEGIRLNVMLPDRAYAEPAVNEPAAVYEWGPEPEPVALVPAAPEEPALFVNYTDTAAPSLVTIPDLSRVLRIEVRIEENRFAIAATEPVTVGRSEPARIDIATPPSPHEIVFRLPADTRTFHLLAGGDEILTIQAGEVVAKCSAVILHELETGRRIEFHPRDGRFVCD